MGSLVYLNHQGHVKVEWDTKAGTGSHTIGTEAPVEMDAEAAVKQAEKYIAEARKADWPMFEISGSQVQTIRDKNGEVQENKFTILRPIAGG